MLGFTILRHLSTRSEYDVHGTTRGNISIAPRVPAATIHRGFDVLDRSCLSAVLDNVRPHILINCVGLIKQRDEANDPRLAIAVNAQLPHELADWCSRNACRLVHFSTDCVFAGDRGGYRECDLADADDLYGRSKRLGEVAYGRHLTLRTSLIGHELESHRSLVDWFLGTSGRVSGYAGVIFSGLPTIEIARVLSDHILPDEDIVGLYHLSAEPIDKYRLLCLLAAAYGHKVQIERCLEPKLDRSLNSTLLRQMLNYRPPAWDVLIANMNADFRAHYAPHRTLGISA